MTEDNTTPPDGPTVTVTTSGEVTESTDQEPKGEPEPETHTYVHVEQLDPSRDLPRTNPYLDEVLREKAEIQRAKVEGREPDLENPPAVGSTVLVREDRVFSHARNTLTPKDEATVTL